MPDFVSDIVKVAVFALASFVTLFILSKLLGKKQISQLDFVDYALGITIGSIAGNMATDLDAPFYHYIIAMTVIFLLDLAISFIGRKGPFMKKLMQGKPITIVYEGKIIYENLKKSRISINEFLSLCRSKNYFDIKDIYYAVLETNGAISIVPTAQEKPVVVSDINVPVMPPSLPCYLVCDGNISNSGLSEINKNVDWLLSKLQIQDKSELKNIILASYDQSTDTIKSHTK